MKLPLLSSKELSKFLEKEGFIANSPAGFQIIRSKESEFLYKFIRNCIQNDINYNYLLDIIIISTCKLGTI